MLRRVGLEFRSIDHRELRSMLPALRRVVLGQEHVAREQVVPRELVHHPDRHLVLRVGAAPGVEDEQVLVLEVGHHVLVQGVELRLVDRLVHRRPSARASRSPAPCTTNLSFGERPVCCPVRATSGPSAASERLASRQRLLVQGCGTQVPVDASGPNDSERFETERPLDLCGHTLSLPTSLRPPSSGRPRGLVACDLRQPPAPRNARRGPAVYGEDPDRTGRVGSKSTRSSLHAAPGPAGGNGAEPRASGV